ncbi:MAG TPA: hypothetical protein VJS13_06900 [Pyrinomonadaceae bacterium]|nr:hypothetical protein [Pyrinomonadaceae bacterium]
MPPTRRQFISTAAGFAAYASLSGRVALNRLRYIFITHHHSEHNLEFGPLIYNGWITGVPTRVDAYGPPGRAS